MPLQATGEQQYIKGNTKFFAVALAGGGGPIAVVPYENKGTFDLCCSARALARRGVRAGYPNRSGP